MKRLQLQEIKFFVNVLSQKFKPIPHSSCFFLIGLFKMIFGWVIIFQSSRGIQNDACSAIQRCGASRIFSTAFAAVYSETIIITKKNIILLFFCLNIFSELVIARMAFSRNYIIDFIFKRSTYLDLFRASMGLWSKVTGLQLVPESLRAYLFIYYYSTGLTPIH